MTAAGWAMAVPLAGAVVTAVIPRGRIRARGAVAAVAAVLACATAFVVAFQVASDGVVREPILRAGGLEVDFHADGVAAALLVTTGVVNVGAVAYAYGYFADQRSHAASAFWPRWLTLHAAMAGVYLLNHTFALYVAFEVIGVAAVGLVVLDETRAAVVAGLRYLVVAVSGSLLYLAGAVVLWAETGLLDIHAMGAGTVGGPLVAVALALMTVGLLLTAAVFPLHFWLPTAHTIAPSPASPILSALVLKVYFYAVVVLWFQALPGVATAAGAGLLAVAGASAIAWGGVMALRQTSVKRLVAYSTLSQMGYLWLIPAMLVHEGAVPAPESAAWYGWHGGVYYAIAHSSAKAAMLMAAGALVRASGGDDIERLRGAARGAPLSTFAFALAGVNLVGLPPTGGFVGKWYLLTAAFASGQWWIVAVVLAGGGLTAAYLVRVLGKAFADAEPGYASLPRAVQLAPLALTLLTVALGFRAIEVLAVLEVGAPGQVGGGG